MLKTIIDFVTVNNSVPVVAIAISVFVIMTFVQAHYIMSHKVNDIKKETRGLVKKHVDSVMIEIEETSFLRAKDIMNERWLEASTCEHGETEYSCGFIRRFYPMEEDKFREILQSALDKTKQSIFHHIDINGFHDKAGRELEIYCEDVGVELFEYNKRIMKLKGIDSLVLVKDTHGIRFTRQQSVDCYRGIIDNVIRLEKEESVKISEVKQKLRINGKIFNLFKGYLDE